jgi:hypothetical protein
MEGSIWAGDYQMAHGWRNGRERRVNFAYE